MQRMISRAGKPAADTGPAHLHRGCGGGGVTQHDPAEVSAGVAAEVLQCAAATTTTVRAADANAAACAGGL